jgi:hypothetical protein
VTSEEDIQNQEHLDQQNLAVAGSTLFYQDAMKKSIFDVQLMDGPGTRHNNTQN